MKNKIILILVLVLALFLRVYKLDQFPAGLNADEAAIGYNAFSLLQTGKDEYGESFPLAFKSFGDYKPGLYFYMVVPFVRLLGLNEWAVRLPSALLGLGTVYLIYLLAKKIFEKERVAILASLLLAISPWHLHFSRGGWETNAATFLISLGVYLFLLGLSRARYLFLSMVTFLSSMYTYQSPRLVIPLMLTLLFIIYRQQLIKRLRHFIKYVPVLLILSVPLILQFTSGAGGARFSGLSYFKDLGPSMRVNELRGEHVSAAGLESKVLHNKLTAYGVEFIRHYVDHFSTQFMFINGDPLMRNRVPDMGQFYIIQSILLLAGFIYLIRVKSKYASLLVVWILVAPIASAMTYQTPHALRALNMVVPLTLVMALGIYAIFSIKYKFYFRSLLIVLFTVILLFETTHYLESYYVHYPKRYPLAWEYGFKEMVNKLGNYEKDYKKVVITDRYDQPYILVLFFKGYDPKRYQPQAALSEPDKFNFSTVRGFDNYEFRKINKDDIGKEADTLYIASPDEVGEDYPGFDKVYYPNGKPVFIFIKT